MIPFNPVVLRAPRLARRIVRSFGLRVIALSSITRLTAHAQPISPIALPQDQPLAPVELVAVSPLFPDFKQSGESLEEIKRATGYTPDEKATIDTFAQQSTGKLLEILRIYERMGNPAMVQAIAREILNRIPDHPDALRLTRDAEEPLQLRKPGYLEENAAKLMAGQRTDDPEAADAFARSLAAEKQYADAAFILEKLRELNFKDAHFPYLDSLADCYFDLQRWDDAEASFSQISKNADYPDLVREHASRQIEAIAVEKRIARMRDEIRDHPDRGPAMSARLIAELPQHPSVIAFRMDCLRYAGKDAEATKYIAGLRAAWKGPGPFPYERILAHSNLQMRKFDDARQEFQAIATDDVFDDDARADARKGILLASISRKGEAALAAADRGEQALAEKLLAELENEHRGDIEVAGYRAAVLARLNGKDEALRIIEEKKAAAKTTTFPLQDTLGDVYTERREFAQARAAYQAVLDDKNYDWDERRRAMDGIKMTRKVEIMDDAFFALRDRRLSRARAALATLRAEFGGNIPEVAMIDAEIKLAENKVAEAKRELEAQDIATPTEKLFPGKASLASAQARSGEWETAKNVYADILERAPAFTPDELRDARRGGREMIPRIKQTITTSSAIRFDDDGSAFSQSADYFSPWFGGWRAGVTTNLDLIYLDDAQSTGGIDYSDSRFDGAIRVQRKLGPRLAGEITGGASQDDPLYGARFGNFLNPGLTWAVSFLGNIRSTDSVRLQAADARENRLEFQYGGALPGPWNLNVRAYGSWMHLGGGEDIGNGYGANALIEYVWRTETIKRPEIAFGLFNDFQHFRYASDKDEIKELFDGKTHRHGIQVSFRKDMSDRLRLTATGGTYYAFDESSLGAVIAVGANYYISDDAFLYAELRYDTSARSSGGESGAGSLDANVGASISF